MSNENSKLEYESGVTPFPMEKLTDSGDRKTFDSQAALFSESAGNTAIIRANGILTGGVVSIAASASNDVVDVASMTLNLNGVEASVSAGLDTAITRAATDVASITSITIIAAGTIAVVKGVDSADATFSEVRGDAGGPPLIPIDSVEIAQIRTTSNTAAPIDTTEIFRTAGTHMEKSDFPSFSQDNFNAQVVFDSTLAASHTGGVSKAVHASYADPIFVEQAFANDFVPSENSHSVSSEQVYNATVGTSTSSLGQGSFTAILKDGITDALVGRKNLILFFRFTQDRSKTAHILSQGKLGLARTFAASDNPKVAATISSDFESVERAS